MFTLALCAARASYAKPFFARALLALALAALFHSPLAWLARGFSVPEYRLHMLYLGLFLAYFAFMRRRESGAAGQKPSACFLSGCKFSAPAFALLALSLCAFAANRLTMQSNIADCVIMGATAYAVSGFFLQRGQWQGAAPVVLLFFFCLPLSYHAETFVGFPLRLLSAQFAEAVFNALDMPVESAETILRLENTFTHIDLPCSGVKSLFSIIMLTLALSVIERYRIGLRWLSAITIAVVAVIAANLLRVILLVALYNAPLSFFTKESLHLPIGMATFLCACAIAAQAFLQLHVPKTLKTGSPRRAAKDNPRALALLFGVIALAATLSLTLPSGQPHTPPKLKAGAESLPLTEKEAGLFIRHGVTYYEKSPFAVDGQRGTAFLVLSGSWRGHHPPEQCLQAQGYSIEHSRAILLNEGLTARLVTLKESDTAVLYWFQSADGVTEDYASRVWRAMLSPGKRFVMNSIFIEKGTCAAPRELSAIAAHFQQKSHILLGETP